MGSHRKRREEKIPLPSGFGECTYMAPRFFFFTKLQGSGTQTVHVQLSVWDPITLATMPQAGPGVQFLVL